MGVGTSSSHADALAEAKYLESLSDENLLDHYSDELIEIRNGSRAVDLLPRNVIKKFRRLGVLNHWARAHR